MIVLEEALTREELESYNPRVAECERLRKVWEGYEGRPLTSDAVTGSSHHIPYGKRTFHVAGRTKGESQQIEVARQKYLKSLEGVKSTEDKIESIEDVLIKEAIYNYYIYGSTWGETATEIGYRNTAGHLRKVINGFLDEHAEKAEKAEINVI